MDKDVLYTIGGSILGSLIEEGIEEIFPGVGELKWTGEIAGAIAGLLGSQLTKDEIKESLRKFIKYAYKETNKHSASKIINDDDLILFDKEFKNLPKSKKKEILNNFKNLAPYDYDFIVDFFRGMEN